MTNINPKEVKQTLNKLPLELINVLLVGCDKNCSLTPLDDANNPRKTPKRNRDKLTQSIIELNDIETYNKALDLVNSFTQIDDNITSIKEELAPIEAQGKEKKTQIKQLHEERNALISVKTEELKAELNDEESNKINKYNSDLEKAHAEMLRQKTREKGLKAYAEGLMVSIIDDLEEEYVETIQEVENSTKENAEKFCSRIKEDQKINLDTVKGMNLATKTFSEGLKIPITQAINKTKLDLEFKNNAVMSSLSRKATKSVPQTLSVSR